MKLGLENINFKITIGRTVLYFSCITSFFARIGALFGTFIIKYVSFFLVAGVFLKKIYRIKPEE